jgi:hypothetical protein
VEEPALDRIRRTIGGYNFAGQYQSVAGPARRRTVKVEWFKRYREDELPARFDRIVQSWDTGIGENAAPVRSAIARACSWLGLELDEAANREHRTRISTPKSRVAAYVIKTDENLMIARHARALVGT